MRPPTASHLGRVLLPPAAVWRRPSTVPLPLLRSRLPATIHASRFVSSTPQRPQAQQPPQNQQRTHVGKESEKSEESEESEESKERENSNDKSRGDEAGGKAKQDAPPPPPHGDKTPWQVFTETLQHEFQASKEWNESTKQLGGSLHDLAHNPQVQKAAEMTEAAKSKTAQALKATGRAVGQGAAWTWDTMPVKGVRAAARVTGTGLDYATRPVRQTKAFQAVKETIDDGSSSRYGGWTEKEERKRRRELRELNELQRTGGRRLEPLAEDPE